MMNNWDDRGSNSYVMDGYPGEMTTTRTRKTEAVAPEETPKAVESPKCDNHPDRDGTEFTGGGAFRITLCGECTPPWFKTD